MRYSRIALTAFLAACILADTAVADSGNKGLTEFLLNFNGDTAEPEWVAENDDVMGGISTGAAEIRDGVLSFEGSLSLENNGGFAQVGIQDLEYDWSGKKGIKMRVMGDGRTYEFRLATNARHRGSRIAYSVELPTEAGEWIEVELPLADLKPSHHGRSLDGPAADLTRVEEISLLIGDRQEGPFKLDVDWMTVE